MSAENFPKKGEIWWVSIPNQPHDPHQPRTCVIVSDNGRNQFANDVIVVPTTSQAPRRPHPEMHVHLPAGEGGLPKSSYAKCDQVTTVDKDLLDKRKGPLGTPIAFAYRLAIITGIRRAVGDISV